MNSFLIQVLTMWCMFRISSTDAFVALMIIQFVAFSTAQMRGYGATARVNMVGMTMTGATARSTRMASANGSKSGQTTTQTSTGGSFMQKPGGNTTSSGEQTQGDDTPAAATRGLAENNEVAVVVGSKRHVRPV